MGRETDELEEDGMKWRNWHIIFWPLEFCSWNFKHGYWPRKEEPIFKYWNILFWEVRKFIIPKGKVCKKCGQELPK